MFKFNAVEDEVMIGWVAGEQHQMVPCMVDIPSTVDRCRWTFGKRCPITVAV